MSETGLVLFDAARRAIALATTIDEVRQIRNKAEALRQYIRQQGAGLEMQNQCAEIKLRAERRVGEMLAANTEVHPGGDQTKLHDVTLADLGISRIQSSRWQLEASIPEVTFEQFVAEVKSVGMELTSQATLQLAQRLRQQAVVQQVVETPPWPTSTFATIVIDPPWPIEKIEREVRPNQIEMDYPSMTLGDIAELPIGTLTEPSGSHIYLWTTHKHLPAALGMFEAWGIRYQCLLTWVKNVGMTPYSWMYSTEHVLFGRKGNLPLLQMGKRLDFEGKVREHSRKPEIFYEIVREVSPAPRLDMFSRQARAGFESWGAEVGKFNQK